MTDPLLAATLGLVWRWWDGRGWGPGALRVIAAGFIAFAILAPLGWAWALPLAGLWAGMWTPRQKNRAEWDDMALRWALPVGVGFGALIGFATLSVWPLAIMSVAGLIVATLVWLGVHWRYDPPVSWLDSSAVTEALSGAVAFGALSLAVN